MITMEVTEETFIAKGTAVYRLDDETLFYWRKDWPQRLYVKLDSTKKDAELPEGKISSISAFGNSMFFVANHKIFNVFYSPLSGMNVVSRRTMAKDEVVYKNGFCSRICNGKRIFYRLSDKEGIQVDASEEELKGLEIRLIHRGKVIFTPIICTTVTTKLRALGNNAVVVELPASFIAVWCSESSPYVYISLGNRVHVLDSGKGYKLTTLVQLGKIDSVRDIVFASFEQQLMAKCKTGSNSYLTTFKVSREQLDIAVKDLSKKELELSQENSVLSIKCSELEQDKEEITAQMLNAINIHENKISQLTQVNNTLQMANDDMKSKIELMSKDRRERNSKIAGQAATDANIKNEMQRAITQLRNANTQLAQEKIEMNAELTYTINELRKQNAEMTREKDLIETRVALIKVELNDSIDELRRVNNEVSQENDRMKHELNDKLGTLQKNNLIITAKMKQIQRLNEEGKAANVKLREEIAELTQENKLIREKAEQVEELNNKIRERREIYDLAKVNEQRVTEKEKSALEKMIIDLHKEVTRLTQECDRIEKINDEVEQYDTISTVSNSTINNLREVIEALKQQDFPMDDKDENENDLELSSPVLSINPFDTKIAATNVMETEVAASPVPTDSWAKFPSTPSIPPRLFTYSLPSVLPTGMSPSLVADIQAGNEQNEDAPEETNEQDKNVADFSHVNSGDKKDANGVLISLTTLIGFPLQYKYTFDNSYTF